MDTSAFESKFEALIEDCLSEFLWVSLLKLDSVENKENAKNVAWKASNSSFAILSNADPYVFFFFNFFQSIGHLFWWDDSLS